MEYSKIIILFISKFMKDQVLFSVLALLLVASLAEDNQMNGPGNTVFSGTGNVANGQDNTFRGNNNQANGNANAFVGDSNAVQGSVNDVNGDKNKVAGLVNSVEGS
jgi:hypothetical protein